MDYRTNPTRFGARASPSLPWAPRFGSAHRAADPNQVAQRLKEVLGGQGVDVDYGKVSGDATHVVLEATTAKVQGSPDTIPVGTVTLDDVSDQDGGYRIGRLALPNFSLKQDGLSIDAADADLVGLKLPAPGATDPLAALLLYERATLGTVKVSRGDQQLFSLTDTHLDVTPPSGDQALDIHRRGGRLPGRSFSGPGSQVA